MFWNYLFMRKNHFSISWTMQSAYCRSVIWCTVDVISDVAKGAKFVM